VARGVLLAIAALGSACVVPVGPKFEDDPNYAPYIVATTPTRGSVVPMIDEDAPEPAFSVIVADPNINDVLRVRWIVDYPKYDPRITAAPVEQQVQPNGAVVRDKVVGLQFTPDCILNNIAQGITQHRLTFAVADREFLRPDRTTLSDDGRLDSVTEGGYVVRANWSFNLDCR
jgi:hypothetical protein